MLEDLNLKDFVKPVDFVLSGTLNLKNYTGNNNKHPLLKRKCYILFVDSKNSAVWSAALVNGGLLGFGEERVRVSRNWPSGSGRAPGEHPSLPPLRPAAVHLPSGLLKES